MNPLSHKQIGRTLSYQADRLVVKLKLDDY